MRQSFINLARLFVAAFLVIRAREAVKRGWNVNVVGEIIDNGLPVLACGGEGAISHVDGCAPHMFGSGYLWRELSIRAAFGAIAAAHSVEDRIARALRVGDCGKTYGENEKIHHKDTEEPRRGLEISESILSRLKESCKRFLTCRLDMIARSFSTSPGVHAWDTLRSTYF